MASFGAAAWFIAIGEMPLSILVDPGPLLLAAMIPLYGLFQGWAPLTGAFLAWAVLHRLNRTGPWWAAAVGALAGAAAPFCANLFPMAWQGAPHDLLKLQQLAAVTTLLGAVIGVIVRRIAYGRVSADPRQP